MANKRSRDERPDDVKFSSDKHFKDEQQPVYELGEGHSHFLIFTSRALLQGHLEWHEQHEWFNSNATKAHDVAKLIVPLISPQVAQLTKVKKDVGEAIKVVNSHFALFEEFSITVLPTLKGASPRKKRSRT